MGREQRAGRGRPARAMGAALGIVLVCATVARADPAVVKVTLARGSSGKAVEPVPREPTTLPPEPELDQVLSIEELGGVARTEQEQILTDLIANTPDSEVEEKSNYYFMLGALHAKLHRQWRQKSVELGSRADQSKNPKARAEATAAADKAKQYLLKTVKTYKGLVDNEAFRSYQKLDVALFYYGYTLQSGQFMTEARQVFDRLLKNHPQSKYAPEAHLIFADYFFGKGQLADAEPRYRIVLKFPRSSAYWYAMYKLGRIHTGQQRPQEALETFFQVVQGTRSDRKLEAVTRAAVQGFVRAFAEIGKVDKAYAAFQRVDGPRALGMLQDLADVYLEEGKGDRAIFAYQELLRVAPGDPNACLWQYNIARATAYNAGKAQTVEICAQDVGALRDWGRPNDVAVSCAGCALDQRRP